MDPTFQSPLFKLGEETDGVPIEAFKELDDGMILVGGKFTSVNGHPAGNIVRLNRDGSVDTLFDTGDGFSFPRMNSQGVVGQFEVLDDGKILVLGRYNILDGKPANKLIRLNPDGSLDETFHSGSGSMAQPEFHAPVGVPLDLVLPENG